MIKPDPEVYLPTSVAMFNVSWVCFVYEVVIGAHEILCGKYLRLSQKSFPSSEETNKSKEKKIDTFYS